MKDIYYQGLNKWEKEIKRAIPEGSIYNIGDDLIKKFEPIVREHMPYNQQIAIKDSLSPTKYIIAYISGKISVTIEFRLDGVEAEVYFVYTPTDLATMGIEKLI